LAFNDEDVHMVATPSTQHDIIVIGAARGGLEVARQLTRDLEPELAATAFVVMHVGASSRLAEILAYDAPLPVEPATSGGRLQQGHVYVGVAGFHLMLHDNHMLLRRGPREDLARPAIDPLFRSAAATFGGRVIGVVLSGALSDGTAGLRAIKRCGGLAVVQDPANALVPAMPANALHHVDVDHVARMDGMGRLLGQLARQPAGAMPEIPPRRSTACWAPCCARTRSAPPSPGAWPSRNAETIAEAWPIRSRGAPASTITTSRS
jgi:two-component system chemotaxis response regulator CheB